MTPLTPLVSSNGCALQLLYLCCTLHCLLLYPGVTFIDGGGIEGMYDNYDQCEINAKRMENAILRLMLLFLTKLLLFS